MTLRMDLGITAPVVSAGRRCPSATGPVRHSPTSSQDPDPAACGPSKRTAAVSAVALAAALRLAVTTVLLSALLGAPDSLRGEQAQAFFEASGVNVRATAPETRLYWQRHRERSYERILAAAAEATGTAVATVLGAGIGEEIPLAPLARRFDRLILADLDGPSLVRSLEKVPLELRAKVDLKVMDVTSFAAGLMRRIERAVEASASPEEAFRRLEEVLGSLRPGAPADLPQSDLVVSSLLLSEIPRYPFSFAAQAVRTRFGVELREWRESDAFFRRLVDVSIEDHIRLLASVTKADGAIYFSDTVARGPVGPRLTKAVRQAVEVRAFQEFQRLGLADSVEQVPAALQRLCRAEHAPAVEAEAFETMLALYRDTDDRLLEPLLPTGRLREESERAGLEIRGRPEAWWWLAYPCRIPVGFGAFLVRSWILGFRK